MLYSSRTQCRANTPVNICVGALIIKEMFQNSDDNIVESLMLDTRYQYALHTTSYEEQPLSDKTLSRFRERCYNYEATYGIDLLHDCITGLSKQIAHIMNISPKIRRMDSLMIETNIKNLSRAKLLYTCVSKFVMYLHRNKRDSLLTGLEHYYDPNDFNRTFYYSGSNETADRIKVILEDAFQSRLFWKGAIRRLKTKGEGGMNSSVLQNPSDPDATFREKAGKQHRGYVANVDKAVGKNGSVVMDYQLEQNNYSDSQFLKDSLERNGSLEEGSVIVTDGAYFGEENSRLAQKQNINLVTTAITGIEVPEIYADFLLNEEGTRVLKCPAGHTPKSSCYSKGGGGHIYVSFPREQCINCPHKEQCRVKAHKKVCSLTISATAQFRVKAKRVMGTEEFHLLARLWNRVETLSSILRRIYHTDRMPVRKSFIRPQHHKYRIITI